MRMSRFGAIVVFALAGCAARTGLDVPAGSGEAADGGAGCAACKSDQDIARGGVGATALAADCDAVFWTTADGVLRRHDASGDAVLAHDFYAASLALDATNVYGDGAVVHAVPRSGGSVETIAKVPCFWLRLRDETLYCLERPTPNDPWSVAAISLAAPSAPPLIVVTGLSAPQGLAVDEENVYVSASSSILEAKRSVPATEQTPTVLATTTYVASLDGIAVDDQNVYFLDREPPWVAFSVPKGGGPTTPLLQGAGVDPLALAVDSSGLYVALQDMTSIAELDRVALDGSGAVTILDGTALHSDEIEEQISAIVTTPSAVVYSFDWDPTMFPPPTDDITVRKKCK